MTEYQIFDISLPDKYIEELTEEELLVLIDEGREEHLRLEREIDRLVWPDAPQVKDDGTPVGGHWPSEFSYLPAFYLREIEEDPAMEKRLYEADDLSRQVGRVLAVIGSAKTQLALALASAEREKYRAETT